MDDKVPLRRHAYNLLDTLIAVRMMLGSPAKREARTELEEQEKLEKALELLDLAIAHSKGLADGFDVSGFSVAALESTGSKEKWLHTDPTLPGALIFAKNTAFELSRPLTEAMFRVATSTAHVRELGPTEISRDSERLILVIRDVNPGPGYVEERDFSPMEARYRNR